MQVEQVVIITYLLSYAMFLSTILCMINNRNRIIYYPEERKNRIVTTVVYNLRDIPRVDYTESETEDLSDEEEEEEEEQEQVEEEEQEQVEEEEQVEKEEEQEQVEEEEEEEKEQDFTIHRRRRMYTNPVSGILGSSLD